MSHQTPEGQTISSSAPGELFGRYRLRGVLGQGGMGRLYVAEQVGIEGFSKIVALKRILPHLADSEHFRVMFLNEARVAARLEHPNIVATLELGEVDGNYFISMEYLSGEDLATVLNRCRAAGPMPIEIATALAQQSANGLHYAHELRDPNGKAVELVHRDVSPLNIFVTYYGMVKLLDFGIVKGAADPSRTVPGVFKGKYAYCAPEQLDGVRVTRQTDIFCLGIVLWECLTGQRLFLRDTDAGTIDAVRGMEIPPPSALRKDVPSELDQIVLQALSRQRIVRFGTAGALSDALDQFLAKRPSRPTSQGIGHWLESLFGAQRATLKKAIAQGRDVETALSLLPTIDGERSTTGESGGGAGRPPAQPRMPWSSLAAAAAVESKVVPLAARSSPLAVRQGAARALGHPPLATSMSTSTSTPLGLPSPSPAAQAGPRPSRKSKRATATVFGLAGALVVVAAVAIVNHSRTQRDPVATAPTPAAAALALVSEPAGAQIIVDGEPSGLTTPSTLTGLRTGHPLEIRLDKVGFRPAVEKVELKPGERRSRSYRLIEDVGTVAIEGMPPQATIYLDDNLVEGRGPLTVALGEHRVRIETAAGVLWSELVTVAPGQQTIHVTSPKRGVRGR